MIDQLRIFRGNDCVINDKISIRQPTLLDIVDYGEEEYFVTLKLLTSSPADRKVEIWDALHIYWDQVDEFELFASMFDTFRGRDLSIILPNIDFNSFQRFINPTTKEITLINKDEVRIDRSIYTLITDTIRTIHQMKKNSEMGYDEITKDCMIDDDRYDRASAASKPFKSIILPFASYLAVRNGFSEVWNTPIGAFFYEMKSEQKVKDYDNVMHGVYSGCVDIKKLNREELNWIGDI